MFERSDNKNEHFGGTKKDFPIILIVTSFELSLDTTLPNTSVGPPLHEPVHVYIIIYIILVQYQYITYASCIINVSFQMLHGRNLEMELQEMIQATINNYEILLYYNFTPRFSSVVYPGADKLKLHIDSKFISDSVKQYEKHL